jgi:predicted HTH transcriptional regulator
MYQPQLEQLRANLEELTVNVATQSAAKSDQESEHFEDTLEDSDQTSIVNIAEYRSDQESEHFEDAASVHQLSPKVTRKLYTKKSSQMSTQNGRGDAQQKALRILKRNPGIGPSELAKRAQISRSYASKILAEHA